MSVQVTTWAWEQNLPTMEKLVLLTLADYATPDGETWISTERLAERTCTDRGTALTALGALWARGLVIVLPADDAGARRYRLALDTEGGASA